MMSEVTRLKNIARAKAWRIANPDRNKANRDLWRKENPDKRAAANRRYAEKHPEKIEEKWRRHSERHPDKVAARQAKYRSKNPELVRANLRAFFATEKGRMTRRVGEAKRRALKKGAEVRATNKQVAALLSESTRCAYCAKPFGESNKPTLDHVIPLSKGGPHSMANLTAACFPCNMEKGSKMNFQKEAA